MLLNEKQIGFHTIRLEDLEQFTFRVKEEDAEIEAAKQKAKKEKKAEAGSQASASDEDDKEDLLSGADGLSGSVSQEELAKKGPEQPEITADVID